MRVFATARSTKSLTSLEEKGIKVLTLDVTDALSIAALKAEITTRTGGKLHMPFNNAGLMYEAPAIESDSARVRAMFDANVFGLFDMVSAFTPRLLAAVSDSKQPPAIINTASVLARIPSPFSSGYNASKAAVSAYSDTFRLELAPLGIKVITMFMGVVATGIPSPGGIQFNPNRLYIDAEKGVKNRSLEIQENGMKPEEFARQVVGEVLRNHGLAQGEYLWKGKQATLAWFLNAVGWQKIFDGPSEKSADFTADVKRSIKERGQKTVKGNK
ncbi:hypothetical protein QQX98_004379 [Neonectria punicea]|uniref:NAD(P)-binding protein n=1 Tax=Neonectria punicea TaxID=979145 RepID=A0ABR1HA16_9HYPO